MDELEKHILFAEKQFLIYKYHDNPDKLKMKALYEFLLSLKNDTNVDIPKNNATPKDKAMQKNNKLYGITPSPCETLFNISEFVKKDNV